jgi:hypothetical protein
VQKQLTQRFGGPVILLVISCTAALGQEITFTTRSSSFDCPVAISASSESRTRGFEMVTIRNSGDTAVRAVYLRVILRSAAGDEVVEERRLTTDLPPRSEKPFTADMGDVNGLRQKIEASKRDKALAILEVHKLEFPDGGIWESREPTQGVPVMPPLERRK